jgi:hypothetical protein
VGNVKRSAETDSAAFELISLKHAISDRKLVMNEAGCYRLAGDLVRAIVPTMEADPVALLITSLPMFGHACGRDPHVLVGDSRHGTNLFTVLVGETSRTRKGTPEDGPLPLMRPTDDEWAADRIQGDIL